MCIRDSFISTRAGVLVSYQHPYRGTQGAAFKQPAINFHSIVLVTLRYKTTLAWASAVKLHLNVTRVEFKAGRTPVNNDSDAPSMGFAESSNTELFTKGVTGHITESRGREPYLTKRFFN